MLLCIRLGVKIPFSSSCLLNFLEDRQNTRAQLLETMRKVLGDTRLVKKLVQSRFVTVIVMLEQLILVVVLESDQGLTNVVKVEKITSVHVILVNMPRKCLQGQLDVNLVLFGAI